MRSGLPAPTARGSSASTWAAAGMFVVLFGLALHYVVHYGTSVAVADDLTQAMALQPDFQVTPGWLWSQHNEHRMPLSRIFYLLTVRGLRDFRAGTLFDLLVLALVAAACMATARRVRGRTSIADAFFPLVLFSWLHTENLLNSFQITIVLTCAFAVLALLSIVRDAASAKGVVTVSVCACLLPLCSMGGGVQTVMLCAWLLWVWWSARRSPVAHEKRAATLALIGAGAGLATFAATFIGFTFPPRAEAPTIGRAVEVTAQVLASPLSWLDVVVRTWSWVLVLAVVAATLVGLVLLARREPAERARSLGLVAVVLASVLLALTIAFGRAGEDKYAGIRSRYALLGLPWTCALFLAACPRERSRVARAIQWSLFGASTCAFAMNLEFGARCGEDRVRAADALERDVARGHTYARLAADHWHDIFYGEGIFHDVLLQLERAGFAPFERAYGPDAKLLVGAEVCGDEFRNTGTERSSFVPVIRRVEGTRVLLVGRESVLEWPLPTDASVVRGSFRVHPDTLSRGAVRFAVTVVGARGETRATFERVLDPATSESDRGLAEMGLAFDPGPEQYLVVRTTSLVSADARSAWGCWSELRLR